MSKYDVNNYHIVFFDSKGSKLFAENLENVGLIKAREYGDNRIEIHEAVDSYIIARILYNSKD